MSFNLSSFFLQLAFMSKLLLTVYLKIYVEEIFLQHKSLPLLQTSKSNRSKTAEFYLIVKLNEKYEENIWSFLHKQCKKLTRSGSRFRTQSWTGSFAHCIFKGNRKSSVIACSEEMFISFSMLVPPIYFIIKRETIYHRYSTLLPLQMFVSTWSQTFKEKHDWCWVRATRITVH